MAKPGIGLLIAKGAPPPGKGPPSPEPDGDEGEGGGDYGDEDKAAETSAAERVGQALGVKGFDPEELCEAMKDFLATIKQ